MKIVIIGAGPTGLTAAVELARRGIIARVIDRKPAHSTLSRAVGINPHTLHLLEASEVTPRLIARGIKIRRGTLHEDGQVVATLRLDLLPPPYDFMLSLPQDETEEILETRFAELGGTVNYHTALQKIRIENGTAQLSLERAGVNETIMADCVIACDGAHSITREELQIPFPGYDRTEPWGIADVDAPNIPYATDQAHLFLNDGVFGFMIPIGPDRYRVVAGQADAIAAIPNLAPCVQNIRAKNEFHIAVRQAKAYHHGPVFLAGDAAHTHTPAGGLGMNTGIADACDLVARIVDGATAGYTAARHPAGGRVITISERLAKMAFTKNPLLKTVRRGLFKVLMHAPFLQKFLLRRLFADGRL